MGDQQNLESQSSKDRAWTTDEIRKHSSHWTLAGDVGLYNLLNEFSQHIIARTHEVENAVDSLVHQTKMTTAKINNVINDFHMLSNLQFVENRVYDEEIHEPVTENKPVIEKTKEQREAEMLPKIIQAIELGLSVLDTAFDRINVNEISDSEDEEDISSEGRTILEPKDPYEYRPLPYIIGSVEFMKCDYAGLKDLVEDEAPSFSEESSISETDETSSDEGEPLPLDDDKFSEKQNNLISQNIDDRISSSDESELFGSEKEVNGFDSESSLEIKSKEKNIQRTPPESQPVKESRQSSVSSLQSKLKLPQVLPVPKVPEKKENEDFFTNEDHSDDESPFRKRTGLFTSDMKFTDEKDEDLFGGDLFGKSPSEDIKEVKSKEVPKVPEKLQSSVPEAKKPVLFDNDEDSEDDIFNTLMKTKKPSTTKTNNTESQDSSEKTDTLSTPSSAPSTKPSGNAFDFVTGGGHNDLFGDDSDGDDLFSSKKTHGKKIDFDSSENEDLFNTINVKAPKESKEKSVPGKSPLSIPPQNRKGISLFDDDDDEDIFSKVSKESKLPKAGEKSKPLSLFEDSVEVAPKETNPKKAAVEKAKTISLFDDTEEEVTAVLPNMSKPQQNNASSLFDDSDNFDLFAPKPKAKQREQEVTESTKSVIAKPIKSFEAEPTKSAINELSRLIVTDIFKPVAIEPTKLASVPKSEIKVPKAKEEVDGIMAPKVSSSAKNSNVDSQISFDTPVDSSNVLNVINKSRVKITAKRRKPTRQGRLAALENAEKETITSESETPATKSDLNVLDEDSDNLFSAPKPSVTTKSPKLDHKSQEKKKMNLMSQLISEVATSKVVLKKAAEIKEGDGEEDEIDIFSETAKKDRSKSSFSFQPPKENGIASMFPIEKKEDEKDDSSVPKSDSFEDDFFSEPAFQNFRSSISHKESVLDVEEEEDDDDLFSAIKSNVLPKAKVEASESNDLFGDDTDIFADVQKEKYEMFPNQVYDDDDDDIFSNVNDTVNNKSSNKAGSSAPVKKIETQQVNVFDDPLTGLLEE